MSSHQATGCTRYGALLAGEPQARLTRLVVQSLCGLDTEVAGDRLDRHTILTVASDPHDVLAELPRIRPGHGDILPARPTRAIDLRCHLSVQQTLFLFSSLFSSGGRSLIGNDGGSPKVLIPSCSSRDVYIVFNGRGIGETIPANC